MRGLYALRYDVTRPVSCTRLAFFQLGADRYNTNLFASISRGAVAGHDETWTPPMGGKAYSRSRLPLSGDKPWLAITGNTKNPPTTIKDDDQGAWADRGLIVHRWSARLGGVDVSVPHYSVFGTDDGNVPSAIVELSPPPEIDRLHPGDYVDALVEMVILPQRADDYYGPNDAFRAALREHGGTWKMVQREAVGASLRVDAGAGEVVSSWPVVIRAQRGRRAAFTIGGGNGWVPIRIVGARAPAGAAFGEIQGGDRISAATLTQGPWWQTQYRPRTESYDLVYTVSLDAVADGERTRAFSWTESP
ncbi:MAG: hypothetical protein FJY92_09045 [Candidatus Hydrogenedentes bacterium]|nr:hypothetical protein [Candidatus Hydrogenedentota bacterium]